MKDEKEYRTRTNDLRSYHVPAARGNAGTQAILSPPPCPRNQAHWRIDGRWRCARTQRRHPRRRQGRLQLSHRSAGVEDSFDGLIEAAGRASSGRTTSPAYSAWAAPSWVRRTAAIFAYQVNTSEESAITRRASSKLPSAGLDALVVIGGDGTLAIAHTSSSRRAFHRRRTEDHRQRYRGHGERSASTRR